MKLLFTVLLIVLFIYLVKFTVYTVKRTRAHLSLKALANTQKFKLKFTRSFFASFFKMSHAPDLVAEIGDKIYLLRFYNGRGQRYQVHFANEEYSVSFPTLLIRSLFAVGGRLFAGHAREPQSTTAIRRRVKIMPMLEIPEEYKNAEELGKQIIPILVFNPAPGSVSYVSDEKTSIKLAFTGDSFRGIKIFTASSVVNFLEREARYLEAQYSDFSI